MKTDQVIQHLNTHPYIHRCHLLIKFSLNALRNTKDNQILAWKKLHLEPFSTFLPLIIEFLYQWPYSLNNSIHRPFLVFCHLAIKSPQTIWFFFSWLSSRTPTQPFFQRISRIICCAVRRGLENTAGERCYSIALCYLTHSCKILYYHAVIQFLVPTG